MSKIIEIKDFGLKFKESKFEIGPNLNLIINRGDFIGIVGESGCGKSTLGKVLISLINNNEINTYNLEHITGNLQYFEENFQNFNLLNVQNKILRKYRKKIQMIFQNPRSALNLKMHVIDTLIEAVQIGKPHLKTYIKKDLNKIYQIIFKIIRRIDVISPNILFENFLEQDILNKYNGNLSGGERRRISIAKAMCVEPDIIVADEPLASLDASIKSNVLNYFKKEWEARRNTENPLTIIIISHDFGAIVNTCNRFVVMYGNLIGKRANIIEEFNNTDSFDFKKQFNYHPYTQKLISSVNYFLSDMKGQSSDEILITNDIKNNHSGCVYSSVCEIFEDKCIEPSIIHEKKEKHHLNSCVKI